MGFLDKFEEAIDDVEEGCENIIEKGEDWFNKI
jgi:hypothetical protein